MRKVSVFVVLALGLLSLGLAQESAGPPQLPPRPTTRPFVSQELHAPYWTMEPGWHTDLEVRNNLGFKELTITPVLRTTNGTEVQLEPITLKPEEIQTINLEEALAKRARHLLHTTNSFGSVAFRYDSPDEANVFAAAMVHSPGKPISFHFDAEPRHVRGWFQARRFESIWWLPTPHAEELLVLSNVASTPLSAEVVVTGNNGVVRTESISLAPREVRRISGKELWPQGVKSSFGGISVRVNASAENLRVAHFVIDEAKGTGAILKVFEHSVVEEIDTKTLRAPMIAMGKPDPRLGLRSSALTPTVLLRNTTKKNLRITPAIAWKSGIESDVAALPALELAPGQSVDFDVDRLQKTGVIAKHTEWAGLSFTYQGSDNDLIALAVTKDDNDNVVAQSPFSQTLGFLYKGSGWYADPLRKSIITAGNGGTKPTTASLVFYYNGGAGRYEIQQRLAPSEQLWLDMAEVIRNRVPDKDGNTLPEDVTYGSYELRDLDQPGGGNLFEGKLTVDKTFGHAAYGCMPDLCCQDPRINPSGFSAPVNTGSQDYALLDCEDGNAYDITNFTSSWTTSNSAVATMGPGKGYVNLVGVGTSNLRGYATIRSPYNMGTYCGFATRSGGGTGSGVCAVPTNFRKYSSTSNSTTGKLTILYTWDSSTGNRSDLSGCSIAEIVTYPGTHSTYTWAYPMVAETPNPTTASGSGSNEFFSDSHSPPNSFSSPYMASSFQANQVYRYSCGCHNNGNPVDLGTYTITRSVSQNADGSWKYSVTKSTGETASRPLP